MQQAGKKSFSQSLLRHIDDKMHEKPNTTSSAAVSHERSIRSNVRKASKISFSLYPLYSYTTIFDLSSAKKISHKETQIFLKNKILKCGEVLPFLDILRRL